MYKFILLTLIILKIYIYNLYTFGKWWTLIVALAVTVEILRQSFDIHIYNNKRPMTHPSSEEKIGPLFAKT